MCQLTSRQGRWVAVEDSILKVQMLFLRVQNVLFSAQGLFFWHSPYPVKCNSFVIGLIICDELGDDGEVMENKPLLAFLMFLFFRVLLKLVRVSSRRRGTPVVKCFFFCTMPTTAAAAAREAAPSSVHLCSVVCKTLAGSPCIFNTCAVISSRFAHLLCRGSSFPEVRALSPLACQTQKLCLKFKVAAKFCTDVLLINVIRMYKSQTAVYPGSGLRKSKIMAGSEVQF